MAEPPPSYSESLQQQGPAYGAYQGTYGTVPNMGPQTMQPPPPGAYPPYGGVYAPQQGPAGAYNKPSGPYPLQQPGYPPSSNVSSYQTNYVYPTQSVVLVGGCPSCRAGVLEDDFTCLGVLCAIMCFPIGILCCLAMRQRRCSACGAVFG
ncbi:brain protein I3 [Elysia marginata]|uniref:Membrane protein BRI3 n=1 Tax=Elysia marginata TaxID=1093978 RepID=A0AAV4HTF6_9GAST|nr:brain protein I3 [Elysia marginata]